MEVKQLQIKNFRCFSDSTFAFNSKLVILQGDNGSGKISLLEALYFLCYVRSFRTYYPNELCTFGKNNFFIKASYCSDKNNFDTNVVQVGVENKKKLLKINNKSLISYKELIDHFRLYISSIFME